MNTHNRSRRRSGHAARENEIPPEETAEDLEVVDEGSPTKK